MYGAAPRSKSSLNRPRARLIYSWSMGIEVVSTAQHGGEVIIPHDAVVRPITAVRNSVVQGSLAMLRHLGLYERYVEHIDPAILQEISTNLGPHWMPVEVAHAHYRACDDMALSTEELEKMGQVAGQLARKTSIVVATPEQNASFDLWDNAGRMQRVWKRLYQGGSVQVVKLGPATGLLEFRQFALQQYYYYRHACLAALRGAHEALGLEIEASRIVRYDPKTHDVTMRLDWK